MKQKRDSITRRWIINTLLVIATLLIVISVSVSAMIRNNYYKAVYSTLRSASTDVILTILNLYGGSRNDNFYAGAIDFVENFSSKNIMDVWVIDKTGRVIVSSSGFEIKEDMSIPEYNIAVTSKIGQAEWTGRLPSGEKIMALTTILTLPDGGNAGAVRYMISLEEVDGQLIVIFFIIAVCCLFAIALVVISGMFFVRSIIRPIQEISVTANQIAQGDLNARIDHYFHNDEIGALCETINSMASELSAAEKIKLDFISTVSHELRTPLTAIMGWGETLLQIGDTDSAMQKRGLAVIVNEVSRLSGIVEELLDFSKMQSGRMELRIEKVDVLAELDETVFYFKERAISEGIELLYNVPHTPAPMNADADRIRQVFINILDNSFKYTEQGGKINIIADVVNANLLKISISDTGCGIPTENLPKVKEKFYKVNNSVGGSGIGLAVSDEIVRMHGGVLEIDSILGEGTTVTITLKIEEIQLFDENGENDDKEE
jgi:signal transduction histidine kinase